MKELNKWWNITVSEDYFIAKFEKFPGSIAYFVRIANIAAIFTSMHTHVCMLKCFAKYGENS